MKKALTAMGLVLFMVLALFAYPAQAQTQDCKASSLGTICATLVGNDVVVTLLGQEIARISAPVKTITVEVPVPGPTKLVPIPGPTRLIPGPIKTVPVPGPTKYIDINGPTETVTLRPGGQAPASRVTMNPSARPSGSPNAPSVSTPTVTITKTAAPKVVTDEKTKKVIVTIPQAIGLSVGLLLLGLLIGLLALYSAYGVGYKNADQANAKEWRSLSNELFRKRKH